MMYFYVNINNSQKDHKKENNQYAFGTLQLITIGRLKII